MRKLSFFTAAALAMASLAHSTEQTNVYAGDNQQTSQRNNRREALPVKHIPIRLVSYRNDFGGFSGMQNVYKHIRKDGRNQRQYRKWLRSNPQMRRSKKSK